TAVTDFSSDTPLPPPQPANRNDPDLLESNVSTPQPQAADTGASPPVRVPIATPDENHAVGIQEDKLGVPTLPEDTRPSVQEERPTVTPLEEKPIARGSEKSTKATPDKRLAAIKTQHLVKPRAQRPPKGNLRSRAQAPSK